MTWTYKENPNGSDRDAVRFLSGDTDTADQLVTDEEINFALEREGGTYLAAAVVCDALAAKFSREADSGIRGGTFESCSQRAKAYRERANDLRSSANAFVLPTMGVQTISGKIALDTDANAVQPSFKTGMNDNPHGPGNPIGSTSELTRDS